MNKLELVKSIAVKADLGSTSITTVQGSLSAAVELLVDHIDDAHQRIQLRQNWRWLRRQYEIRPLVEDSPVHAWPQVLDITDGRDDPPFIDRFKSWRVDAASPPRLYRLVNGQWRRSGYLTWLSWDSYLTEYRDENIGGIPAFLVVDPQDRLVVSPTPDAGIAANYMIQGEYNRGPQRLVSNTDVPEMPEPYHLLIVAEGLQLYGFNDAAEEVLASAGVTMQDLIASLGETQSPRIATAPPLA